MQSTGATRRWLIAQSVASLVVGFVFLLAPQPSLTLLMVLAGVSALLIGGAEILFAFRLPRLAGSTGAAPAPSGGAGVVPPEDRAPRAWRAEDTPTQVIAPWPDNPRATER
jgi:Short repeat of unknown function (DUF308)